MFKNLKLIVKLSILFAFVTINACSDAKDLIDLAVSPPGRKPIQKELVGVNNFFVNQNQFGSIDSQYQDIRQNLGVKFIRVLFAWSNEVQPTPGSSPNYSFYDEIAAKAPADVDLLVVIAHTPTWFTNTANWVDSNPRKAWIEQWLKPTIARYRNNPRIIGFEIPKSPCSSLVFFLSNIERNPEI